MLSKRPLLLDFRTAATLQPAESLQSAKPLKSAQSDSRTKQHTDPRGLGLGALRCWQSTGELGPSGRIHTAGEDNHSQG